MMQQETMILHTREVNHKCLWGLIILKIATVIQESIPKMTTKKRLS